MDLQQGSSFAGHRIEGIVARGGMGVVYRATDLSLERTVAIKLIAPEYASNAAFRERFVREARIAASLEHPNIASVYAAGEWEGTLYLAMRFVEGHDLRELLDTHGPMDTRRVALLVEQIAAALDAAHARGLVHRDVKPANVLVDASAHAFLTDFGLTKHAESATTGVTRTGQFVGTLDYVAPEQIRGVSVDARTDVYALGCVVYELLTAQRPYVREGEAATMFAHLNDPPPKVTEKRPDLSVLVDEVVARALAKDPADRFPSAGDLARALTAATDGQRTTVAERVVATGAAAWQGETVPADAAPMQVHLKRTGQRSVLGEAGTAPTNRMGDAPWPGGAPHEPPMQPLGEQTAPMTPGGGPFPPPPGGREPMRPLTEQPAPPFPHQPPPGGGFGGPPYQHAAGPGHYTPPPPRQRSSAGPVLAAFAVIAALLLVGGAVTGVVLLTRGDGDEDRTTSVNTHTQTVTFQPPTSPGRDPFTKPTDIEGRDRIDIETGGNAGGGETGSGPFGGSGSNLVCDRELLISSLRARPDRMRAWARSLDVTPTASAVARYIRGLRPATLVVDTRITNHTFANGRAVPFQAILQAGTAVLVDDDGRPVVRCRCGNPLLEAVYIAQAECVGCPANYTPPKPCAGSECFRRYPSPPKVRRPRRKKAVIPTATPTPTATVAPTVQPTETPTPEGTPMDFIPTLQVSPSSGTPEDTYVVEISNFPPNRTIQMTVARPDGVIEKYTIDTDENGVGTYVFPPDSSRMKGTYTVTAVDDEGNEAFADTEVR